MDLAQYAVMDTTPEFIQNKIQSSEWFDVSGDIDDLNDTIEYVPIDGQTAFLFEAKITMKTNPTITAVLVGGSVVRTTDQVIADLLIDSVVKDKATVGFSAIQEHIADNNAGGPGSALNKGASAPFSALGKSLIGDGAKKIEIKNVLDAGSAFAEMSGWLSDT